MAPRSKKLHPFEEQERSLWSTVFGGDDDDGSAGAHPAAAASRVLQQQQRFLVASSVPVQRSSTPLLFDPDALLGGVSTARAAAAAPVPVEALPMPLTSAPLPSAAELLQLARKNNAAEENNSGRQTGRVVAVRTARPMASQESSELASGPPAAPRNRVLALNAGSPAAVTSRQDREPAAGGDEQASAGAPAAQRGVPPQGRTVKALPPRQPEAAAPPASGTSYGATSQIEAAGAASDVLGPEDAWYNASVYVHPGEEPSPEEDLQRVVATSVLALTQLVSPDLSLARLSTLHSGSGAKTLDTPAPFADAMWNVVYIGTLAFALYQASIETRESLLLRRIGWYAAAAFGATSVAAATMALASRGPRLPAVLATTGAVSAVTVAWMVALCTALAWALLTLVVRGFAAHVQPFTLGEHLCVVAPLSLYAGWITILTAVNYAGAALASGALALSVLSPHRALAASLVAAAGMSACAGALTSRGNPWYAAGAAWGLLGISIADWRFHDGDNVLTTCALLAMIAVLALAALRTLALRRNRWTVQWHELGPVLRAALDNVRTAIQDARLKLAKLSKAQQRGTVAEDSELGEVSRPGMSRDSAEPAKALPTEARTVVAAPPRPLPKMPPSTPAAKPVVPAVSAPAPAAVALNTTEKLKAIKQGNAAALAALAASRAAMGGGAASAPASPAVTRVPQGASAVKTKSAAALREAK